MITLTHLNKDLALQQQSSRSNGTGGQVITLFLLFWIRYSTFFSFQLCASSTCIILYLFQHNIINTSNHQVALDLGRSLSQAFKIYEMQQKKR